MMNSHFPKLAIESVDFQRTALFLDVDGTMLDIAATPESVVVPDGLAETIGRLEQALGGALAIVTGARIGRSRPVVLSLAHPRRRMRGAEMRFDPACASAKPAVARAVG